MGSKATVNIQEAPRPYTEKAGSSADHSTYVGGGRLGGGGGLQAVADIGSGRCILGKNVRQLANFVGSITFGEEADLAAVVDCRQSRKGFKQLER